MKTIVTDFEMFKATVKQDGKIDITLVGGKQLSGQLTQPEVEQLLFRVSAISDGVLTFDPEPRDLVGLHEQDVSTLEEQSLHIEVLRLDVAKLTETLAKKNTECEEAKLSAESLGKRLGDLQAALAAASPEVAATVHNVQTTEQASSVHNVQSEATP